MTERMNFIPQMMHVLREGLLFCIGKVGPIKMKDRGEDVCLQVFFYRFTGALVFRLFVFSSMAETQMSASSYLVPRQSGRTEMFLCVTVAETFFVSSSFPGSLPPDVPLKAMRWHLRESCPQDFGFVLSQPRRE